MLLRLKIFKTTSLKNRISLQVGWEDIYIAKLLIMQKKGLLP